MYKNTIIFNIYKIIYNYNDILRMYPKEIICHSAALTAVLLILRQKYWAQLNKIVEL